MPNFIAEKKHVYSLVQKKILIYIANFALHDNCEGEGGDELVFLTHLFQLC